MAFLIQVCLNQFFAKILYIRHPNLSLPELILLRSLSSILIFLCIMNRNIYNYLVTNVPRHLYKTLLLRCSIGCFQFTSVYYCIMYFPVVFVTLIQNLSPLLIALFSYALYRVKLNLIEVGVLIVSFVGFIILVTGSFKESTEELENVDATNVGSEKTGSRAEIIVACILMIMIPFNGAIIQLSLRKMKSMSEITLAVYIVTTMLLFSLPYVILFVPMISFDNFKWVDWLILILLGISGSFL